MNEYIGPISFKYSIDQTISSQDSKFLNLNLNKDGIDKDEEHELHLKQALKAQNVIPIPSLPTLVDNNWYNNLYPEQGQNSISLIKFSDTVEDSIKGSSYNMDEQDEEWLLHLNIQLKHLFKTKEQTDVDLFTNMSEAEFEFLMEALEDASNVLQTTTNVHDKNSESAYTFFKTRINPSNRKTRRSNQFSLIHLLKIRQDLNQIKELMKLINQRELLKLKEIQWSKQLFEQQVGFRNLKRKLGQPSGDEELSLTAPVFKRTRRPSLITSVDELQEQDWIQQGISSGRFRLRSGRNARIRLDRMESYDERHVQTLTSSKMHSSNSLKPDEALIRQRERWRYDQDPELNNL
ncbi:Enhancer of polycomb-like protein 1 [Microbotryomycetes sp. JL221]|nr:Enhancer of polycomb-like protein 1 [Microbotryomycetes sp. JL221]